ncbi:MAG: sulfite exporter TauE/SafE family protein [Bacteroidales bacterium]|nr:sulfite exporter TauE/SafE family protein [Bacteroidales bacterium]
MLTGILFALLAISVFLLIYVFGVISYVDFKMFLAQNFSTHIYLYILVGFFAQLIDGTLGMAYGVSSTSFLISTGVSPIISSASVHTAEIFTSGISGLSHWKFKNVDKQLFLQLALPGVIGAILGAYFLSSFDGNLLKPYITIYLFLMGVRIIYKAYKKINIDSKKFKKYSILGLIGGFVDASGGGGWGPVVTTTLVGTGKDPKITIGTVNAAEFLVTIASSSIFTMIIGIKHWTIILGLLLGGILAAPLAAFLCHKINSRWAMYLVGVIIIGLSIRTLLKILL